MTYFDPQPRPDELPARMPSPFAHDAPVPLAARAADALRARLGRGDVPGSAALDEPGGGKMFGVLVVAAPDGRVGFVCGFSGMLAGRWAHDGFAPPLFDPIARDAFWPAAEDELRGLEARHRALATEAAELRAALEARVAVHDARVAELRARHADNRRRRHEAREASLDAAARRTVRRPHLHGAAT